jgi:hypothetical protein
MTAYIIMHNMIFEDERDLGRIESPYESGAVETIDFFHLQGHQILCHLLRSMKKSETLKLPFN